MTFESHAGVAPTVSVVITLYNKGPYVQRALASVFAQSISPMEVIVVDDCSTDDGPMLAKRMLESWPTAPSRFIRRSRRGGSCARPRMTGFDAASGECVAYLDADDEWDPDFLKTCVSLLQDHPECSAAGTLRRIKDGDELQTPSLGPWSDFSGPIDLALFAQMRLRGLAPIRVQCSVFTREAIIEAGGFSHAPRSSDVDFIYRFFLSAGRFAYSARPKATIHRVPDSTMASVPTLPVRTWRLRALEAAHVGNLPDAERSLLMADVRRSVRSDAAKALRDGKLTPAYSAEVRATLPLHEQVVIALAARLPTSLQRALGTFFQPFAAGLGRIKRRRLS